MSTFRRLRRVTTTRLALFVLVYSAVVCETSSIFDFFKRSPSTPSSSPSTGGTGMSPAGSNSKTGDGNFQNFHHYHTSVSRSSADANNQIDPSQSDPTVSSYEHSSDSEHNHDSSHGRPHNGHSYSKDMIARGHGGGWGGWGGGHGHHDSNLDLYSLLGGLSFASLLGATIVYLARRSSTTTVVMNTTGRRRRRDLDDADDELVGESLPDFLAKLGVNLDTPWWKKRDHDNKFVIPFKLNND